MLLEASSADHLRLDIDRKLVKSPLGELIHDGTEYLCLRYAVGRRLISDQTFVPPNRHPRVAEQTRVLIVAIRLAIFLQRDKRAALSQLCCVISVGCASMRPQDRE